ncbi:MAG TPA: LysR family transcriptional regulator [Terriglobia bacterium]|nr:LysR family transcriptional regulator [Terriglobia bacterium]
MSDFEARKNERWCRDVLAELGTFHAACVYKTRRLAGTKLGKEGQSVGRSIARLESLLKDALNGGFLIDPSEERKVIPTDAGKVLELYCEELIAARARLLSRFADLQQSTRLRIATTHYAWMAYGSELQRVYRQACPDGVLDHGDNFWQQDRVWNEIEARVLQGLADVGIYSFPPTRAKEVPEDLEVVNWIDEEFVLVFSKDLARLVKRDQISILDFSLLVPFLPKVVHYKRELNFDRTDLIEEYLRRQRVLPRFDGDWLSGVDTIEEMKATLLKGGAISLLPWPTVAEEHLQGRLKAYPLNLPMRPRVIRLLFRRHNCRRSVTTFLNAAATIGGARRFPD